MNIITLIDEIVAQVAQDTDIASWCQTTYSNGHMVYVNLDERNLPPAEKCPYIAIWPASKRVGRAMVKKEHFVEVVCCIYDESEREHPLLDNVVEYSGVSNIESFRKLVETSIAGIDFGNRLLSEVDIDYETIEFFPFFFAGMQITIRETVAIGGEHLA